MQHGVSASFDRFAELLATSALGPETLHGHEDNDDNERWK